MSKKPFDPYYKRTHLPAHDFKVGDRVKVRNTQKGVLTELGRGEFTGLCIVKVGGENVCVTLSVCTKEK